MTILSLDYESKSRVDLFNSGLYAYARDPSTRVLMAAYAIDDGPVQLWEPHKAKKAPAELAEAIRDPKVQKFAWNAPFESAITLHTLGAKNVTNWRDTMVCALYASLPGALALAGVALGLPEDQLKMPEGKRLIRKFSIPRTPTKDKPYEFADWNTDPEDWELFCEYCKRDVEVERTIRTRLASLPVPEREWRLWELDREINDRGIPVDLQFVQKAIEIGATEKARLVRELKRVTGLSNPMTQANFLAWAHKAGYPYGDLRKATVDRAIREGQLRPELVDALAMRSQAAKTSMAKFDSIAEKTRDGRIYNTLQFYGASRTGRWAGRDPQIQNLSRPLPEIEGREAYVTDLVRAGEYDELQMEFGKVIPAVASVTRSAFRASEGKVFYTADLNAIENRVLGWLADCDAILEVFRKGLCPYLAFATFMYGQSYEELHHEFKVLKIKTKRTNAKPAVLGGGYMLGGGEEKINLKTGDVMKTGLWGYAEAMGISMTQEQAHEAVRVFRESYPEVVQFWYALRDAAFACVRDRCTIRVGKLVFNGSATVMRVRLPNGRILHYVRPRIEEREREFSRTLPNGQVVKEKKRVETLTYEGVDQLTKKWGRITTHPGKLTENFVQAVARDLLAEGLLRAKAKGFDIIAHVHDEIVCEVPVDSRLKLEDLISAMADPIDWAPGLPLKAEGEVTPFYKK